MDYLELAKQWAPFVTILGVVITVLYRLNKGVDVKIFVAIKAHEAEEEKLKKADAEILKLKFENFESNMKQINLTNALVTKRNNTMRMENKNEKQG